MGPQTKEGEQLMNQIYQECLAMVGLTAGQVADPTALNDVQRRNLKWAQEYTIDVINGRGSKEHWHPAFKQEKLRKHDWDRAWAEAIPDMFSHRIVGKGK